MSKKDIAIVFMVAGISSRFGGRIKQFAKIGPLGETLIEFSLNQAIKEGFTEIYFIVGNKTEQPFKEKFGNDYQGVSVNYVNQVYDESTRDRPWGTGDAICTLKNKINCPFVVCNGDDIYGENPYKILFNHLKDNTDEATLGYKLLNVIPDEGKIHRGIFQVDKDYYVKDLNEVFNIEKSNLRATNSSPDDLCSMNIFALHPKVIDYLSKNLEIFKDKNKGDRKIEFLIPNEISKLIKSNKIKMKIYPCDDNWTGITNPEDEEIVREKIKNMSV